MLNLLTIPPIKQQGIFPDHLPKTSGVGPLIVKSLVNIALNHVTIDGTIMIIYKNLTKDST